MILFPGLIGSICKIFASLLPSSWNQQQILSGSLATETNDNFGQSVSINSTGNRIIVGAWQDRRIAGASAEGLAYIYVSGTTGWNQEQILSGTLANNTSDNFGWSVSMNSTGDRVIVGAYQDERVAGAAAEGLAYIYVSGTSGWSQQQILSGTLATATSDNFGFSVAMNSIGDRVVVGAWQDERAAGASAEGLAYIFVSGTTGWNQQQILSGTLATAISDNFGASVAINSTGNRVIIGARQDERTTGAAAEGLAYIYVSGTTGWNQEQILSGTLALETGDNFGWSVAINSTGNRVVVGARSDERSGGVNGQGLVYVYVSGTTGWNQEQILSGTLALEFSDTFGQSVTINSTGDCIVVGAWQDERPGGVDAQGLTYIFVSGAIGWTQQQIISGTFATGSADNFGNSVAINSTGNRIIVGAYNDEKETVTSASYAANSYVFRCRDVFGDGWGGSTMQVRQGVSVIATLTGPSSGFGPTDQVVALTPGVVYNLFFNNGVSFPSDLRVEIVDPNSTTIYNQTTAGTVGSILHSWTAVAGPGAIINTNSTQASSGLAYVFDGIFSSPSPPAPLSYSITSGQTSIDNSSGIYGNPPGTITNTLTLTATGTGTETVTINLNDFSSGAIQSSFDQFTQVNTTSIIGGSSVSFYFTATDNGFVFTTVSADLTISGSGGNNIQTSLIYYPNGGV